MTSIACHYRGLKRLMAAYGCSLPKRPTILAILVFDRFTRGARLGATRFPLSRRHRQELGHLFTQSCALVVLLGYDDSFDQQGERDLGRRYDYLIRALGGFLAGFHSELPIPHDEYFDLLGQFEAVFDEMKGEFSDTGEMEQDRMSLRRSPFVEALDRLPSVSASDFIFPESTSPSDRQRNVPIVAAIQLGRTVRRLHDVLRDVGLPESILSDQERAIKIRLIKAGYAQAHTVEQCDIDQIGWKRYCRLSLWKTNSMVEIVAFIRGILNVEALRFRLGCNRFCEQIYLDDLYDIVEDTKGGIFGAAHVFLREQGILATTLLRELPDLAQTSWGVDYLVDARLVTSGLLGRWSEGAFLQANPLFMPPAAGRSNDGDWRTPLHEALMNNRWEEKLSLEELLARRRRGWEELSNAWRARDYGHVLQVLHLSGVPLRLVRGFLRHLHEIRHDYLPGGRPGLSGARHFLFLQVAARLLLFRFWLAHRVASVVSHLPAAALATPAAEKRGGAAGEVRVSRPHR